jgi:Zn-dependent protease
MQLFRVAGIALEVHPTFYVLPVLIGLNGYADGGWEEMLLGWGALLLVYTCVVLHEFGHALTARALGLPVWRIVLLPIGGMAMLGRLPRRPCTELLIVAAGPLVNFVIAGICLGLLRGWPDGWVVYDPDSWGYLETSGISVNDLLRFLLASNIFLGCFNLLPAFPMDGGRVLRALLALRFDYLRATWYALLIGRAVAVVALVFALWAHLYMLAILFGFILFLGGLEYTQLAREETQYEDPT